MNLRPQETKIVVGLSSDGKKPEEQVQQEHQMGMALLGRKRLHEMLNDPKKVVLEDAYQQLLADEGLSA